MQISNTIRLLASSNNQRGDLFTRLTKDLFFSLGYDELQLDVHKSGREIDVQGKHRFEPRVVIAECKAHSTKMGGEELNKFFGVLNRERKKLAPTPVAGYFLSLSGYTETAKEQEIETGDDRIILLDSRNLIVALENSRVVVTRTQAVESAGRCAQHASLQDAVLESAELLGHERGYIWLIYYTYGKERTHFALIAADGTPLSENVAREIVEDDRSIGGTLHSLRYLAPPPPAPDRLVLAAKATDHYREWLAQECGYIYLDGLPADADLSATRLKLERLFVPLRATFVPRPDDHPDVQQTAENTIESIGEMLQRISRLALLAMPGGGKSTLLKRLATAYAFPERRSEIADGLPARDWLPVILRCRELRDRAHRPIIELLDDIPRHVGMNEVESDVFRELVHARLRDGRTLLLIDGLDEISDEGARQAFAKHLRTFVAMFPQIALIVTSREAGFRLIAGVVASACVQAKLAPLDEEDVVSLCERWHIEVVGDTAKVREEAKELARTIWANERIRPLIENPLLLTTLLVVKRWIGELPRNRAGLYREAIRVLIRTWNVEGYLPLDEDETLAQLSYVACAMMEDGKQQIVHRELLRLLQNARRELEAELQFARISPQDFIERIELRSSILMQTGHERIDNLLQPVYEFRHLTFQEYLAARGYVEEQYPGRDSGRSLAELLESHFEDERWQEVIPLAAVLAGRKAEDLVNRLILACKGVNPTRPKYLGDRELTWERLGTLLYRCIRDEVQITAPTLRTALLTLALYNPERDLESGWDSTVLQGKFGTIFREIVEQACLADTPDTIKYLPTLVNISILRYLGGRRETVSDAVQESLLQAFESGDRLQRIHAALACMHIAYSKDDFIGQVRYNNIQLTFFQIASISLSKMITCSDATSTLAACWAFAWIGRHRVISDPPQPELLLSLYRVWRHLEPQGQGDLPAWALAEQPLLPRDTFNTAPWGDCDSFLLEAVGKKREFGGRDQSAALVIGWYRGAPWTDLELVEQIAKILEGMPRRMDPTVRELLENLGDAGNSLLDGWERAQAKEKAAAK